MQSDGKFWRGTAVITGAGSGLGAAMAERFAAEGMAIVALDIDGQRAESMAEVIRDSGGRAIARQTDVAEPAALAEAADLTRETFGNCNVLCCNVGVQQFGAIERLTEPQWRWVMDINVQGVVNTVSAFLPLLRTSTGNRRIVLTSSSSALVPGIRLGAYTTSKFAVMGFGETLRMELEPEDIGVSIFFPSGMTTRHLESSALARPVAVGDDPIASREDIDAMMASRNMTSESHTVTPEYATRNLLQELADNRRYIISHGEYLQELEERNRELVDAYHRAQA